MKTRTTSSCNLVLAPLPLKKTFSASPSEIAQDLRMLGQATIGMGKGNGSNSHLINKRHIQRHKHKRLLKLEELIPFLGLASFISESEAYNSSLPPPDELSWQYAKQVFFKHIERTKDRILKPLMSEFNPGKLRRSATHAAIAYYIWKCWQVKQVLVPAPGYMADITLTIKSLDSQSHEITVSETATVADLKATLEERFDVPMSRQRLLYRTQLLEDARTLVSYGIAAHAIVNLVSYTQRDAGEEEQGDPLASFLRDLGGFPAALITRRPRRQPPRRDITEAERVEAMRQSLATLDGLMDMRNRAAPEGDQILGFDFSRRTLAKGTWVDVKDTVDQWLEAQIIDVRQTPAGSMVFVHYNGWPSRWDEWIDTRSARIQPLRAKTFQSISAPMHSPYPVISPDPPEAVAIPPQDLNETALHTSRFITQTKSMMERYYLLHTIMKHERAVERVQPMQDRLSMMQRSGISPEERKIPRRLEETVYPPSDSSEAQAGSEDFSDSMSLEEEDAGEEWSGDSHLTTEQEFNLLSVQMAPILDRFGRLLCDLGVTISKDVNQQMGQRGDLPAASTMPTPAELYALNANQYGQEAGMQIALFTLRGRPEGNRDSAA